MRGDATLESLCEAGAADALVGYFKQHPESAKNSDRTRVSPLMQAFTAAGATSPTCWSKTAGFRMPSKPLPSIARTPWAQHSTHSRTP
jgi:hypothetical protein